MNKILIVEDDADLRQELKLLLEHNGYIVSVLERFSHVCEDIQKEGANLVLLDINLPGMDGESLLRQLRRQDDVPVIMVTSRNTEMDELLCMSYGADDFIAKPYHPSILLLHIEAVLKRVSQETQKLKLGNLVVDVERSTITGGGKETELTKNEMKILTYLLKRQGQIVSRDSLMNYLWDTDSFVDDNTLTVNINRVRRKLEEHGMYDVIKTKRGQGYRIG
ncbi:MAG: response regulator transcription factor [Lachnospiraceae bacterium]|nr:response regulator transcription factor [Lachnospiraceae bacterium]